MSVEIKGKLSEVVWTLRFLRGKILSCPECHGQERFRTSSCPECANIRSHLNKLQLAHDRHTGCVPDLPPPAEHSPEE